MFIITFDTPKFYIANNEEEKALKVLSKIYKPEYVQLAQFKEKKAEKGQHLTDAFNSKYRKQLLLCCLLFMIFQSTGLNSVNFYSSKIFFDESSTTPEWEVRVFNVSYALVRIVGAAIAEFFIDKNGRKQMLIIGCILTSIFTCLFGIAGYENALFIQKGFLLVYSFIQSLTFAFILPIYASELLSTYGMGIVVIFDCLFTSIIILIFPLLALPSSNNTSILSVDEMFFIYSAISAISVPVLIIFVKETKNKTLDEIYKMFHADNGLLEDDLTDDNDDNNNNMSILKL